LPRHGDFAAVLVIHNDTKAIARAEVLFGQQKLQDRHSGRIDEFGVQFDQRLISWIEQITPGVLCAVATGEKDVE
jgi:hypothetical protein